MPILLLLFLTLVCLPETWPAPPSWIATPGWSITISWATVGLSVLFALVLSMRTKGELQDARSRDADKRERGVATT